MGNILEIIIKAQDMASDVIDGVKDSASEAGSFMENNWGKVTAVTAAAGAAAEGFARSQADTNAIIEKASIVTGESAEATRDMIDGLSSWGFGADEVAAGMDELIKRGINTKEGFEAVLPVADAFADATGSTVPDAIKQMDSALSALGIPLEEAADHVDTFTLLSQQSTVPVEQFERQIGKVGPQLQEMGLGLDETAAFLLALEGKGLSGRNALREFASAADLADGDLEAMKEELGLTDAEIAEYTTVVEGAEGMTEKFGEANEGQMTIMEKANVVMQNALTQYGGLAQMAGMLAPALMAIGPIMGIASKAGTALTAVTGGLSKAMTFLAANPIVLIIAAIAALVAAIIWLYNNNETFRNFVIKVWQGIQKVFEAVWKAIQVAIEFAWNSVIKPIWNAIKKGIDVLISAIKIYLSVWKTVFSAVGTAVKWAWENVISPAWEALKKGLDLVKDGIKVFKEAWSRAWDAIKQAVRGPANGIIGFINTILTGIERLINAIGGAINKIPSFTVPGWVPGIGGKTFKLPTIPTISIPRIPSLASGGIAMATPGGFLARIAEGGRSERIQPIGGPNDPMVDMVKLLQELIRAVREARTLSVDGRELASAIGGPFVDEVRARTGL